MDMLPNPEQQQIIDSVREFFASEFSLQRLQPRHRATEDRWRSKWPTIGELGFFGLGLAEQQGGFGCTLAEELLLFREAGRFLVAPSLLAQVIGARLMLLAGMNVQHVVAGAERIALLVPIGVAHIGSTPSGEFHLVDDEQAHWLIAWNEHGAALLPATAIINRSVVGSLDATVTLARVQLDGVRAHAFVPTARENIDARAAVCIAAELVGIAEAARDMAVEYAKVRKQFDQPIGAFQAIKHKCADMAVRCEASWFQTIFAGLMLRDGQPNATQLASAAVLLASSAAHENAAANVQVHGGMGYTAECSAHHFVKRARLLERLLGGLSRHQRATLGNA